MALTLEHPESMGINRPIVLFPGWGFRILTVLTMTGGTMLLMWLGEQVTQRGIGNGISLIITISIISRLPGAVQATMNMFKPVDGVAQFSIFHLVGLLVMLFLVVAGVIAVTQAQRKIPVQYAQARCGRKVYGGQSTLPCPCASTTRRYADHFRPGHSDVSHPKSSARCRWTCSSRWRPR